MHLNPSVAGRPSVCLRRSCGRLQVATARALAFAFVLLALLSGWVTPEQARAQAGSGALASATSFRAYAPMPPARDRSDPHPSMAPYRWVDTDTLSAKSADGKAVLEGQLDWGVGGGLINTAQFRHYFNGDPPTRVRALKPVGCIGVRLTYMRLFAGVSVGGMAVSCRQGDAERPRMIVISPAGRAYRALWKVRVKVCTSASRESIESNCGVKTVRLGGR